MTEPVPKYLFRIYCALWRSFEDREFSNEEANDVIGRGERYTNQALHYLKKSGWLVSKRVDSSDMRKHVNQLVDPMAIKKNNREPPGK